MAVFAPLLSDWAILRHSDFSYKNQEVWRSEKKGVEALRGPIDDPYRVQILGR